MSSQFLSHRFFEIWLAHCERQRTLLYDCWWNSTLFTKSVFEGGRALIKEVARELQLHCYCGYYCIDAILYGEDDLVPGMRPPPTWVRRIRVAFEHENDFYSGLHQEVSHLLITDCDLRVLVSYPDHKEINLNAELQRLHELISGSDRSSAISKDESFLFIVGWKERHPQTIEWRGYIYKSAEWVSIGADARHFVDAHVSVVEPISLETLSANVQSLVLGAELPNQACEPSED